MQIPFFSIIIPSYNRAHIILDAIQSVQQQTFTNWECIIVDDGSTDNTREVLQNILDTRIRYIYQDNAERSAARNNGARNAIGEYLIFLDSDDSFLSNHLEILYNRIIGNNKPHAMYFVHANLVTNSHSIQYPFPKPERDIFSYLLLNPIIPTRVCIHSTIFNTIQYDEDVVIVEDLLLWLKISEKFPVYEIQEYTINYLLHDENSVSRKYNSFLHRYRGLQKIPKRYPEIYAKIDKSLWKKTLSDTLFGIARYHLYHKCDGKAVQYILYAIITDIRSEYTKHRFALIAYMLFFKYIGIKKNIVKEYRS